VGGFSDERWGTLVWGERRSGEQASAGCECADRDVRVGRTATAQLASCTGRKNEPGMRATLLKMVMNFFIRINIMVDYRQTECFFLRGEEIFFIAQKDGYNDEQ